MEHQDWDTATIYKRGGSKKKTATVAAARSGAAVTSKKCRCPGFVSPSSVHSLRSAHALSLTMYMRVWSVSQMMVARTRVPSVEVQALLHAG